MLLSIAKFFYKLRCVCCKYYLWDYHIVLINFNEVTGIYVHINFLEFVFYT